MTRYKSWVLTDVAADVWVDSFGVSNDSLRLATPHAWSVHKRTLRGGLRDGVDVIEVENGALAYSVLPTRGMGLWRGEYRGNFLGWKAPLQGPVHPKYVNLADRGGLGWLGGFDEWLCRCGLASNGPPGEDVVTDAAGRTSRAHITLHGRIANQPADHVAVAIDPEPPHAIRVIGGVEESGLFCPHLRLTATFSTVPGSNRLTVHDVVENRSAQPAEMEMLYHLNVGAPLLELETDGAGASSPRRRPTREEPGIPVLRRRAPAGHVAGAATIDAPITLAEPGPHSIWSRRPLNRD